MQPQTPGVSKWSELRCMVKLCACIHVLYYAYSKDVRLPANLQRAMAAEAEATREAKAKVLWI